MNHTTHAAHTARSGLASLVVALLATQPFAACAASRPPFDLAVDGVTADDTLAAADDTTIALVITHDSNRLIAVDRAARNVAWTKPLPGWAPNAPAFYEDVILVAVHDGQLLAFARADGHLAWQAQLGSKLFGTPLVDAGTFYIGGEHDLIAVDLAAHAVRWRVPLAEKWAVRAPPVRQGARLYLTVGEDLIGLDAATGAVAWRYPTTTYAGGDFQSPALVVGDRVIAGTPTKSLVAVAADSGKSAWKADPRDHTFSDRLDVTPFELGDRACFSYTSIATLIEAQDGPSAELSARATCVDIASGVTRWSTDLPLGRPHRQAGTSGVAAGSGKLWIGYQDKLVGFDADDGGQTSVALPAALAKAPARLVSVDAGVALILGEGHLVQVRVP